METEKTAISIITVVRNAAATIADCIESVQAQSHPAEHIIIDGGSTDGTLEIIERYRDGIARVVSEPDKGIYDAMNKGIRLATGDVVGTLNADDLYVNNRILEIVSGTFASESIDCCYGDLYYVDKGNTEKVVRYWKSGKYQKERFKRGWMPPHPTFFARREIYEKYGMFDTSFPIAADYELMLRFLYKYDIRVSYIPEVLIKMRTGGASNPGMINTIKAMFENYRAWQINELDASSLTFFLKPASKLFQYFR